MRTLLCVAWTALLASPGFAAASKGDIGEVLGAPIDMLYPEIAVDDDGWRGLLPVILYNIDELADQSAPAVMSDRRSEREEAR